MTDITSQDYIAKQIQKLNITDVAIKDLEEKYLVLTINSIEDKETYKVIDKARKHVKSLRVDVDKKRKELNTDALKYQNAINAEAKRVTELLKPIELHLEQEQKTFDAEVERIKQLKAQEELERIKFRTKKLVELGFVFDGETWKAQHDIFSNQGLGLTETFLTNYSQKSLISHDDEVFSSVYLKIKGYHEKHLQRLEKISQDEDKIKLEAQKKLNEALELQRKEQEKERIALENERMELKKLAEQMAYEASLIELKEKKIREEKLFSENVCIVHPDSNIPFPRLENKDIDNQCDAKLIPNIPHPSIGDIKFSCDNVQGFESINISYDLFSRIVKFLRKINNEIIFNSPNEIVSDALELLEVIDQL